MTAVDTRGIRVLGLVIPVQPEQWKITAVISDAGIGFYVTELAELCLARIFHESLAATTDMAVLLSEL